MPRFYMHVRIEGDQLVEDPEGVDLRDVTSALAQAQDAAKEIVADLLLAGRGMPEAQIEVADESGHTLAVVEFSDLFRTLLH